MWQILHAYFWKFSKLSNTGISYNLSIIDEVTSRNTTAYFLAHSVVPIYGRSAFLLLVSGIHCLKTLFLHRHYQHFGVDLKPSSSSNLVI